MISNIFTKYFIFELKVIEDADLVAILKDVSTCDSESTNTVEFSNTLQGSHHPHDDQKTDRRQHHIHSSSSNRQITATTVGTTLEGQLSMQSDNEIESSSSLCNPQSHCNISSSSPSNESLRNRKFETERKQQSQHISLSSQIASGDVGKSHHMFQNNDKTENENSANSGQRSAKQTAPYDNGNLTSRSATASNIVSGSLTETSDQTSVTVNRHSQEHKSKHHNPKKRKSRNTARASRTGNLVPLQPAPSTSCITQLRQSSKRILPLPNNAHTMLQPHHSQSLQEFQTHVGTSTGNVTLVQPTTQNSVLQNSSVHVYQQSTVQDIDLYLNSSTSNVSPDSGIQSEGGGGMANSSPLHLTDIASTSQSSSIAIQSQAQPTTASNQPTISSLQLNSQSLQGSNSSQSPVSTQHQSLPTLQQFTNVSPQGILSPSIHQRTTGGSWTPNAGGVTLPATLSPLQHSPGAFYGSYVQPSPTAAAGPSPSPPAGSAQFSTMVATQAAYVYHSPGSLSSNHAPVLLSGLASVSSNATGQNLRVSVQSNQQQVLSQIGSCETPPPTLLPAMPSIHLSPVSTKSQSIYTQLKPKCPSSSSSSSAGSGNESNTKRGRGRPKGSKNKIRKKVTMTECASQTMESSLDRVMYASRTTSPPDDSEDDESDSASDCASFDLPPPPVFMGSATSLEPLKASRGRPRKDPPMLIPQVAKPILNTSPVEKPKHILHLDKEVPISRVRTISKTPLKGAKSCEVILLESDDSTVFSDEDDEDEDEQDINTKLNPPKLPLPLPPVIEKKSYVPNRQITTKKASQLAAVNAQLKHSQNQHQNKINPKEPCIPNLEREEIKPTIERSSSPYSKPPVLKVENSSDLSGQDNRQSSPHPPSLPLQRNETSHSSRKSEKKKKKKKKKSKSKSKHRSHRTDDERHRSKSPYERDSSYGSPVRGKTSIDISHISRSSDTGSSKVSKSKISSSFSDSSKKKKMHADNGKTYKKSTTKQKDISSSLTTSKENVPFSFIVGNKVPKVFDSKYCTLRPEEFWKESDLPGVSTHATKDHPKSVLGNTKTYKKSKNKTDTSVSQDSKPGEPLITEPVYEEDGRKPNCRVLTKASLKEISSSVPSPSRATSLPSPAIPSNGGLPTKTLLNILASTNKPKNKPGRKKKRGIASEWSESPTTENSKKSKGGSKNIFQGIIDQDGSPVSSIDSNKSPFSPRSSIGSASVGSDHGQVKDGTGDVKYGSMLDCSEGYKTFKPKGSKKQKKEKRTEAPGGAWKTKHKNVIDPVFLGEVEYLIQDVASCQLETSQVSRDYWPDRPLDSVPSIFRRQKISATRSKRFFAELVEGGRIPPLQTSHKHSTTSSNKAVAIVKEKPKRGRPKKNSQDGTSSSTTSSSKSSTESGNGQTQSLKKTHQSVNNTSASGDDGNSTAAEQRLPLKKRHRHHIPSKGGGNGSGTGAGDSESGNSSSGCALSPPIVNIMPQSVSSRRYSSAKTNRDTSSLSTNDTKSKSKEDHDHVQKGRSSRKSSIDKHTEDVAQSVNIKNHADITETTIGSRRSSVHEKSTVSVKIKLGKSSSVCALKASNSAVVAPSIENKNQKVCSIEPNRKDSHVPKEIQYEKRYSKTGSSSVVHPSSSSSNTPLIPNSVSSSSSIKSLNIVDSLASCIDKYTGSKLSTIESKQNSAAQSSNTNALPATTTPSQQMRLSKEQQQSIVYSLKDSKHGSDIPSNITCPLTVKTSLPKCSVPTTISSTEAFGMLDGGAPSSPRKRHLLQMKQTDNLDAPDLKPSFVEQPSRESRTDLAPPLLEKISLPNSRSFEKKKVCAVTPTIVSNPRSLIEKHRQQHRRMEMCRDKFSANQSGSKSLSPPRLSPPRLSPPHTTDNIPSPLAQTSSKSPTYLSKTCRNSLTPLTSPSVTLLSQGKYLPNYSDISDDENAPVTTVSPLTIKLKPPPSVSNSMPMNTSKDAEEAFDRLKKEDDKLQNDTKRLQKEVSKRILQRKETAADRILQKQYRQLQEAQAESNTMDKNDILALDHSEEHNDNVYNTSNTSLRRKEPKREHSELLSVDENEDKKNNSSLALESELSHSNTDSKSFPVISSHSPEDISVSVPSDNCDYMELECEIEPFDDESVTPTPPEIFTDTKKSTAIVAPNIKKVKGISEKKKDSIRNKTQRKQQRRVLTIRVKKLKEHETKDMEGIPEKSTEDYLRQKESSELDPTHHSDETKNKSSSELKCKKKKTEKPAGESTSNVSPTKKARKRKRKANKTGFPSVKKKKKKQNPFVDSDGKSSSRSSSTPRTSRPSSVAEVREAKKAPPSLPVRSSTRVQAIEDAKRLTEHEEESQTEIASESYIACETIEKEMKRDAVPSELSDTSMKVENILSIETRQKSNPDDVIEKFDNTSIKKPRGRPPKKKQLVDASHESKKEMGSGSVIDNISDQPELHDTLTPLEPVTDKRPRETSEESQRSSKRSRLYTDEINDEEIDCLSLLPITGMESGLSSEATSRAGSETECDSKSTCSSSTNKRKKKSKNVLFKKKSLPAGLFSDYYKASPQENNSTRVHEVSPSVKSRWAYNVEEHVHGLLPPPYYCGRQLRAKREDFQLPYDLWWLHANKQLPGRDVVATWNYKRIKNNVYFDIKPIAKDLEGHACQCDAFDPSPEKCGEDCLNRMTYTECDPKLCPSGDRCTNNMIQKHKTSPGLERFMTTEKGWGIRTKHAIRSGRFIMEYVGEVCSEKEFKLRMLHEYADDNHHYCLHMDGSTVIDGHRMGGECRFVNHSCNPNCEMQKWSVNGCFRMALFSLEEIQPNDELTYDYNFSLFNPHEGQTCRCGSKDCRGVIGGRTQRVNGPSVSNGSTSLDVNSKDTGDDKKKSGNAPTKAKRSERNSASSTQISRLLLLAPIKPLSDEDLAVVRKYSCFLFRNFEKVRKLRDFLQLKMSGQLPKNATFSSTINNNKEEAIPKSEEMILTGLTALTTARSMQTRRLAIAQDDPKVTKVVKLAQILREIFAQVTTQNGKFLTYRAVLPYYV